MKKIIASMIFVTLFVFYFSSVYAQSQPLNLVPALQILGTPTVNRIPSKRCLKRLANTRKGHVPVACQRGADLINGICYGACPNNGTAMGLYCVAKFPNKGVMSRFPDGALCDRQNESQAGICYEYCAASFIAYGNQCLRPCPKGLVDCGGSFCSSTKEGCQFTAPKPTQAAGLLNIPAKDPPGFPSEKGSQLLSQQIPTCPY